LFISVRHENVLITNTVTCPYQALVAEFIQQFIKLRYKASAKNMNANQQSKPFNDAVYIVFFSFLY